MDLIAGNGSENYSDPICIPNSEQRMKNIYFFSSRHRIKKKRNTCPIQIVCDFFFACSREIHAIKTKQWMWKKMYGWQTKIVCAFVFEIMHVEVHFQPVSKTFQRFHFKVLNPKYFTCWVNYVQKSIIFKWHRKRINFSPRVKHKHKFTKWDKTKTI